MRDLADIMSHIGDAPLALDRMASVGRASVPMGFQRIFDLEMEAVGVSPDATEDDGLIVDIEVDAPRLSF